MDVVPSPRMLFPDSYLVIDGGTEYFVDEISGKSDDVFSEQEGDRDKHGDDDNDLECSEAAPSDPFRCIILF